ncbi:MAG: ABC-F family ATP-binding cassette domain-containing protein, partial [Oligoflexales bacterium]|nr:ABC-F family ATP-binding cassette domain-containing protein [Oligoflexales bacterium]
NLKDELSAIKTRLRENRTNIDFTSTGRRTKILAELFDISKSLGGKSLLKDFSMILSPRRTIGILGGNGTGKTTLLKMINRIIEPDEGRIHHAPDLKIAYFEQNRESLVPAMKLRHALCDTSDRVVYRENSLHIHSWARRFQFTNDHLDMNVESLSGGEQARILIANLMLKEADILLLDEPTNDLDIPTLEVLEESLLDFPGSIVLVTHDRYMLERVCDYFVGLDGEGSAEHYADYEQWERTIRDQEKKKAKKEKPRKAARGTPLTKERKKLSYKDQIELDSMEENILDAEKELEICRNIVEDPEVASDVVRLNEAFLALRQAEQRVEKLYERWSELENKLN